MTVDLRYLLTQPASDRPATLGDDNTEGKTVDEIILKCGITRPFRRDLKGDIANFCGEDVVKANLVQILGTRSQGRRTNGELNWRPEFGSQLETSRFRNLGGALEEVVKTQIVDAIARWEPRIRVTDMSITQHQDEGRLQVDIAYDILASPNSNSVVARNIVDRITL